MSLGYMVPDFSFIHFLGFLFPEPLFSSLSAPSFSFLTVYLTLVCGTTKPTYNFVILNLTAPGIHIRASFMCPFILKTGIGYFSPLVIMLYTVESEVRRLGPRPQDICGVHAQSTPLKPYQTQRGSVLQMDRLALWKYEQFSN